MKTFLPALRSFLFDSVLLALLLAAVASHADTLTWTGASSSEWRNPANWNPTIVPGPGDTVVIDLNPPRGIVQITNNVTVTGLTFNRGFVMNSADIQVTGAMNWTGGTVTGGSLTVAPGATLTASGTRAKTFNGLTLDNQGTVIWQDTGSLVGDQASLIRNAAGARFEARSDAALICNSGGVTFTNAGTVLKSAGAGLSSFGYLTTENLAFVNLGTVEVQSGTLRFSSTNLVHSGVFRADSGATLLLAYGLVTLNPGAVFSGNGAYGVSQGTVAINGTMVGTNFFLSGGTLGGDLTVQGRMFWSAGRLNGITRIPSGSTLEISGTEVKTMTAHSLFNAGRLVWRGGGLIENTGVSAVDIQAGAVLDIRDATTLACLSGLLKFTNAGTLRLPAGTTTFSGACAVRNAGTIELGAGLFALADIFTQTPTGILNLTLGGLTPGTQFGQLDSARNVILDGTVNVTLAPGYRPEVGDLFDIVKYATITSSTAVLNRPTLGGGTNLVATYDTTALVLEVQGPPIINAFAPVLVTPPEQTIDELTLLIVTNTATDADVPAQTIAFGLVAAPEGAQLDPVTGVLTWTPAEAQGPSTNVLAIRATDNGVPPLSTTNVFTVVVNEVNVAPVLTPIPDQTVSALSLLIVTNVATDADLPANALTFSLLSGPDGMLLETNTGVLTWTPREDQAPGTYAVAVAVTDNGVPPLSATNQFNVSVQALNHAPTLVVPLDQTLDELTLLQVTNTATDGDVPAQILTFGLADAPAGMTIDPVTGVITWMPSEAQGPSTNVIAVTLTDNGVPPLSVTNTFTVTVNEVNAAPWMVPVTLRVEPLSALRYLVPVADPDLPANHLTFALLAGPDGVALEADTGVLTWTPRLDQSPSTNFITLSVNDHGVPPLEATNTVTVIVQETNDPPVLTVPGNLTFDELATLTVTNTATDEDVPAQTLTFKLVGAPSGAMLDAQTGVLSWTPTELQGPSTNVITVAVTDNGVPPFSVTNHFVVTVREVNSAPIFAFQPNVTIDELTPVAITNTAFDSDVPANLLFFSLVTGPSGSSLNLQSGVFNWTPTEAQGPSTNVIQIAVSDNGLPQRSATNTFTLFVRELNQAPLLLTPADQTIDELMTLVVTNFASDADLPAQALVFSLVAAPEGVLLDTNTGVLTWTPTEAQGPSTNVITVAVTDSGSPALSATNSFTVVVNEVNSAPRLVGPGDQVIDELTTLVITNYASDADLPVQALVFGLVAAPEGVLLDTNTGVLTWTPTEAQGPSTNVITVAVTDSGSPALGATNSFTVVVNEVNSAPRLAGPGDQVIDELTTLVITNYASDADLPVQALVFGLVAAPEGVLLDTNTGVLTWTPTEAQGPSTNVITVAVTDSGSPVLSATNSFTVVVNEVNSAPRLAGPGDLSVDELMTLVVTNFASDADLPAQALVFSLVAAPEGVLLDTNTGVLTWTPTEAQGPSTNVITVAVTDSGSPPLSATNSFTVVVNEVNSAPVLAPIGDRSVPSGELVSFGITATDADLPANQLTFSLEGAIPAGASLTADGQFSWAPTGAQAGTNRFTVRVTDDGAPAMNDTKSFSIVVTGGGAPVTLTALGFAGGQFRLRVTGEAERAYTILSSTNLSHWTELLTTNAPAAEFEFVDTNAVTLPVQFYRIRWQP